MVAQCVGSSSVDKWPLTEIGQVVVDVVIKNANEKYWCHDPDAMPP